MKKLLKLIIGITILSQSVFGAQFSQVKESQIPSGMPYNIKLPIATHHNLFAGKKVAILTSHGVEEPELTMPYKFLKDRGAEVDVVVPNWTKEGIVISKFLKPSLFVTADETFSSAINKNYDLIILTGGAWNAQVVKTDSDAIKLIQNHYSKRKPIAAICAGTEVLIFANLVNGLRMTGPFYARVNLANAKAFVEDKPMVYSKGILTSRDPNDMLAFTNGIQILLSTR